MELINDHQCGHSPLHLQHLPFIFKLENNSNFSIKYKNFLRLTLKEIEAFLRTIKKNWNIKKNSLLQILKKLIFL